MPQERQGVLLAASAFVMWGLFPLYWPLLEPAQAAEILAHRVVWSLVATGLMVLATRRGAALRAIWTTPRLRRLMVGAGVVIGVNWFTYIWGVNNGYVVETSLGYYINPLVTVLFGVCLLGERLRRWQSTALAIAFVAVVVLSLQLGRPPWISLVLAFSFGTYGLLKKKARVGPVEGVTFEALVLAPVALGYLSWLTFVGQSTSWSQGPGHVLLLTTTGLVTAVPLLCFAGAANRVSLTTVGLLQYIAPTLQFFLGVFVFHESMPVVRWLGFSLVWLALAILTVDSVSAARRRRLTGERRYLEPAAALAAPGPGPSTRA
jgi:chloramphenicol-sensitive protein RarD